MSSTSLSTTQLSIESDEPPDTPPPGLEGRVQLYDFAKKSWLNYNYSFRDSDLFLAQSTEARQLGDSDADSDDTDDERKNGTTDVELTQIWYHGNITSEYAQCLLLSNAGYEVGTFLVRRSVTSNAYCITLLVAPSVVRSIKIVESNSEDGKTLYGITGKKFNSIPDLISYYRTFQFHDVDQRADSSRVSRLVRPLPRVEWLQELQRESWYQPHLTKESAENLLINIGQHMTFVIRESSNEPGQVYAISVYINGGVRHAPIYRDGFDLMLMSLTFTSLVELVDYFTRWPIFRRFHLQKPAKAFIDYISEANKYEKSGVHPRTVNYEQLNEEISLKVDSLKTLNMAQSPNSTFVQVQLYVFDETLKRHEGFVVKFDTMKHWSAFASKLSPGSCASPFIYGSTTTMNSSPDESQSASKPTTLSSSKQEQMYMAEYDKLLVYCLSSKLSISKVQDLEKIRSFKDMISLNYVKAATFCSDTRAMILFNVNHFSRIYPDFSRKSWTSGNFDPMLYWASGCQLVALNFQTPDRPMYINAARFAINGGCGYVLMPAYIRSMSETKARQEAVSLLLKIRILAVRHLRADQAKSILKVQVKTTIIGKQKPNENQTVSTTFSGPCGIRESKSTSKHHDSSDYYSNLQSDDIDIDVLFFEVVTDNQEFCGQAAIPMASLRSGIRSVQLYDKFNEYLDMSALLVDIQV